MRRYIAELATIDKSSQKHQLESLLCEEQVKMEPKRSRLRCYRNMPNLQTCEVQR